MNLSFVTIHVQDLPGTVDFYRQVMGFEVERQFTAGPGVEIVFMKDGAGGTLEFIRGAGGPVEAKGISLGFVVPDAAATAAHLGAHGVRIVHGPATTPGGVVLLHALDPNGVELGFVQYPRA